MLKKLFAGIALACLVTPAFADECLTVKEALHVAKKAGVTIRSDAKVNGDAADRLIIGEDKDSVVLMMFDKGCWQGMLKLEDTPTGAKALADPDAPAPAAPKSDPNAVSL